MARIIQRITSYLSPATPLASQQTGLLLAVDLEDAALGTVESIYDDVTTSGGIIELEEITVLRSNRRPIILEGETYGDQHYIPLHGVASDISLVEIPQLADERTSNSLVFRLGIRRLPPMSYLSGVLVICLWITFFLFDFTLEDFSKGYFSHSDQFTFWLALSGFSTVASFLTTGLFLCGYVHSRQTIVSLVVMKDITIYVMWLTSRIVLTHQPWPAIVTTLVTIVVFLTLWTGELYAFFYNVYRDLLD
jgi:hypothetical protein